MFDIQQVWRTLSKGINCSYYVWEVTQVTGDPKDIDENTKRYFEECIDGTFIMIQCYHYWKEEHAKSAFLQSDDWQIVCSIY